ncbi:alpha-glucosidase [uncultured Sphaerochaeta sp.]|uniref:alpha-glucosidase n=1 Tax=uncultured Sphaerochaeta sp. TaxID=886478 RepID=UPI00263886BB|nr:alpha-glucosidase [uncultured Sphaerochaeta sp.]
MISFSRQNGKLSVFYNQLKILEHSESSPMIMLKHGKESVDMYRGNFFISDEIDETLPLVSYLLGESYSEGRGVSNLTFSAEGKTFSLELSERDGRLHLCFSPLPEPYNRLFIRLYADPLECVWGCGEQFSHFNLRGKNYPLWTQEQGVGRNKETEITQIADRLDRAGGDYHTTFYPQPTFVSSRRYFVHADTYGYADFDFSNPSYHELQFWDVPASIVLSGKPSLLEVVKDVSRFLGRQQTLPEWVYDGIILGMQGGTSTCLQKLERVQESGMKVAGLWIQDWEGEKYTSFGKRLRWNWQWDQNLYPGLDAEIVRLRQRGVRVLGYINPYVLVDHPLYEEAARLDLLGKRGDGSVYLVDFGEFDAAIVDFTKSEAVTWYKQVIKKELIDFGLSGWMADFGEYLPTDVVLAGGKPAMLEHNKWPGYWAEINKDAIEEAGKQDDIFFFMRAGCAQSLKSCRMMWAGDQNVDWSEDDGLPSVLTATLSLAMSGMGLNHSDIGGYTTLYGMKRSKELLIRWAEQAAFTPLMRTHEGNRPKDNWQFDSDRQTIDAIAYMTDVHVQLKPYLMHLVAENAQEGIPVVRPIFLHYELEPFLSVKDSYLLGRDLFVAPILEQGAVRREVLLPDDDWVHLFTKVEYRGGRHTLEAPLLRPAVFYRKASSFAPLFASIQ